MKRFHGAVILLLAVLALAPSAVARDRPDVLFVVVDDLNDWISLLDPESPIRTPNLERLAAKGMLFTRAYCVSAACNPSRVSTLTGLRPSTSGVYGNRTDWRRALPERDTIMQCFRAAGYVVKGAGKVFHHHLDGAFHDDASFDDFQPMAPQNMPPEKLNRAPDYGSRNTDWGAWPADEADTIDFRTVDYAVEALRAPPEDAPLFLACGIFKPHSPFFAPEKYHQPFADIALPVRRADDWSDLPSGAQLLMKKTRWFWDGMMKIEDRIPGSYPDFIRSYAACCAFADAQIGRLVDALEASPRGDGTIVVLWSDHGFHLGEKSHIEKFALWEKANRVPFIVVAPGVAEPGSRCARPVDLSAVYPTLLELAGLPADLRCDGRSLVPLLDDPRAEAPPALMTYGRGNHAVRSERWRYIRYADGSEELYDHDRDPHEWTNLASRPEHANILREHHRWLPEQEADPVPDLKAQKSASVGTRRPNVLFLAVDDMKDWVGCLGGYPGTVHTPHIDRLAASGMLFSSAHCPSPKCAPSRAAILTGLMPSTTGLYDNGHWWLPNLPDVVTLPAHFRAKGYRVAGAGKIFHHTAGNHPPNQWDEFQPLRFRDDPWFRGAKINYPWSDHGPFPAGFPFSGVAGLGHENDWGSLNRAEADTDDSRTADYAIDFLGAEKERPFFLACGLFRPHLPWYVPRKYFELYPIDDIVLPEIQSDDLDDVPAEGRALAKARRSDFEAIRQAGKWKHAVRAYLASISYADAQLGRVLDALDRSPHADNTIIVLWSDHGWHLGEKNHWHKTTLWEEATRVPFIVAAPGKSPGECRWPVSLVDLYPTLNELCGLPAIEAHDGISLVPLLDDPNRPWERPAIIEYQRGNAAVRSENFRYIRYRDGGEEFYDLEADPHEWHNLAADPAHAETRRELARWLPERWADAAPTKSAFVFDPDTFTWIEKATGRRIDGAVP